MAAVLGLRPSDARATPPKPEVSLAFVVRVGTGALGVGGEVTVQGRVVNSSSAEVTVMLASPNGDGRSLTRSSAVSIPANSSRLIPLKLKIEPRKVRHERFTTQISIVDPAKPTATNVLAAAWRDGNLGDNLRTYSVPVVVTGYDVSVTLTKIEAHNDCNPTSLYGGTANWFGSICAAGIDAGEHARPLRTGDYETYCGRAIGRNASDRWPATGMVNVDTGKTYKTMRRAALKNVPKNHRLVIGMALELRNGLGHHMTHDSGKVGQLERVLTPAQWNNGGIVKYSPPKRGYYPGHASIAPEPGAGGEYGLQRHVNCGDKPYTATFTITTAPRESTLH